MICGLRQTTLGNSFTSGGSLTGSRSFLLPHLLIFGTNASPASCVQPYTFGSSTMVAFPAVALLPYRL